MTTTSESPEGRVLREFLGESGDTASITNSPLHRAVCRALSRCISDHGKPVTREEIGSAAKRVAGDVRNILLDRIRNARAEAEDASPKAAEFVCDEGLAERLYEAWRVAPSLRWRDIVEPRNPSPPGATDETPHFVARWLRVARAARSIP